MMVQREGKIRIRDIESLNTEPLHNLFYDERFPSLNKIYANMHRNPVRGLSSVMYGGNSVAKLGKPNVRMVGYESTPGAWVFDDTETGIIWVIFSDCYKKNHYKGTSHEVILPPRVTDADVLLSVTKLFKLQGVSIVDGLFVIDEDAKENDNFVQ